MKPKLPYADATAATVSLPDFTPDCKFLSVMQNDRFPVT